MKGHMADRMPRHIHHRHVLAADREVIAIRNRNIKRRQAVGIGLGADNARLLRLKDRGQPVNMIPMVMCQKHRIEGPPKIIQRAEDRAGFGRIDKRGFATICIVNKKRIIIGKAGDRHGLKGHGFSPFHCYGAPRVADHMDSCNASGRAGPSELLLSQPIGAGGAEGGA